MECLQPQKRADEETFRGVGYVYYPDCGNGISGISICQIYQIAYIDHMNFYCIFVVVQ